MSSLFLSVVLLVASLLSLAAAQSVSFTSVASNSAFPSREYAACAQSPATTSSTPTLYFYGGFSVTLNATATASSGSNSYYDSYFNDAWSSTNWGTSWTQLTSAAAFPAQGWNGAVYTSSGAIVYIGGGGDSNAAENNQVFISTNGGTFTQTNAGPWDPRENAGIAGQAGTNNVLVALGNTKNDNDVDDIWLTTNAGQSWTQQCNFTACPFVSSVSSTNIAAQVHGPAAAGLPNGAWLLIGGYGSNVNGTTVWVTNQIAYSTDGFRTFSTYTAPWSPRAQQRAVVDPDGYTYVYGGVYDLPVTGSGSYASVPSQAYYSYYSDIYYSTNAASSSATWTQLSVSGLGSAGYPGNPYAGNPSPANSAFYTNGADFNPCLGFGYSGGNKQLILYTGLYAGYRQNNQVPLTVQYPGVYVGNLSFSSPPSTGGAAAVGASVLSVVAASIVALVSQLL